MDLSQWGRGQSEGSPDIFDQPTLDAALEAPTLEPEEDMPPTIRLPVETDPDEESSQEEVPGTPQPDEEEAQEEDKEAQEELSLGEREERERRREEVGWEFSDLEEAPALEDWSGETQLAEEYQGRALGKGFMFVDVAPDADSGPESLRRVVQAPSVRELRQLAAQWSSADFSHTNAVRKAQGLPLFVALGEVYKHMRGASYFWTPYQFALAAALFNVVPIFVSEDKLWVTTDHPFVARALSAPAQFLLVAAEGIPTARPTYRPLRHSASKGLALSRDELPASVRSALDAKKPPHVVAFTRRHARLQRHSQILAQVPFQRLGENVYMLWRRDGAWVPPAAVGKGDATLLDRFAIRELDASPEARRSMLRFALRAKPEHVAFFLRRGFVFGSDPHGQPAPQSVKLARLAFTSDDLPGLDEPELAFARTADKDKSTLFIMTRALWGRPP